MKITRKELRKHISEVALTLSKAEIDAAKNKLSDEGGAAGPEVVAQAAKDAEKGDAEVKDKDVLNALMNADQDIVKHSDGDIIDKSGLEESLTLKTIRDLIREELEKLPSYAYYDYGIDQVPNKTDAHEDIIGHT